MQLSKSFKYLPHITKHIKDKNLNYLGRRAGKFFRVEIGIYQHGNVD